MSVVDHEIVKCSCGAIILQCRCIGPHKVRIVTRGCTNCKAAATYTHVPPAAVADLTPHPHVDHWRPFSVVANAELPR